MWENPRFIPESVSPFAPAAAFQSGERIRLGKAGVNLTTGAC